MHKGTFMYETIRWGIIGTGSIAKQFAQGLRALPDAALVAVGSRTQAGADAFADEFGIPRRHASYAALAADDGLDAIYIATPHPMHKADTLLALRHGKAVLTEKPFTVNAAEAREVIEFAREQRLFLMEAMWTRFIPAMVRVRELLAQGVIGEPHLLTADFGFRTGLNPEGRLFNPALAGGALLDVGVYCLSLASMIFGKVDRITSMAHLGETGVDERAAMILGYAGGQLALLSTAIRTQTPMEAVLSGSEGQIRIPPMFWKPARLSLTVYGKEQTEIEMPLVGNGYHYQAAEVARCLPAGQAESQVMPLDETLSIVEMMDTIRAQWGLKYPME
jgi:predicted dehydrogenase